MAIPNNDAATAPGGVGYTFREGQKVIFEGKRYDFGYYTERRGWCVLYEEGELNMQDSIAVAVSKVEHLSIEQQIERDVARGLWNKPSAGDAD